MIAALSLAVLSAPAHAAPLSFEETIRAAMGGTANVVRQEDAKLARAQGALQRATGAFDWTVALETGWERLYFPESVGGRLTTTLATADTWRTTAGIGRLFRNGISVQPGISIYDAPAASAGRTLGLTRTRPSLSLSIPLLKGGGGNNVAATNERAARINVEGARLARDFAAQREVYDAVRTFWRCLATQRQSAIQSAAQQQTDADVALLQRFTAQGLTEPVVRDRAVANQAVQQVALDRARAAETGCDRDLGLTLGIGGQPTAQGALPSPAGRGAAIARLNEASLIDTAMHNRKDLQALARFAAAADETLLGARNNDNSKVDLLLDTTQAMVRFSMPMGGNAQQGQVKEALASQTEARLRLQELQDQLRHDIGGALVSLRQAASFWETLSRSQVLLEGVAADAQKRQQNGTITAQDLRQTQDDLARVRPQVVDAQLQYSSSLADLHLLLGTIPVGDGVQAQEVARMLLLLPGESVR